MRSLSRTFLLLALAVLAVPLLGGDAARGQTGNPVDFKTFDGVSLKGSFYPSSGKAKHEAVVIILHDFASKKGGGSSQDGIPALAKALSEKGYAVLTFDFRGFGDSTAVDTTTFWKWQHNSLVKGRGTPAKPAESIAFKNFDRRYYPYLVNDIAAARAYLDRANDRKECNSSSIIVIGCGQGATLGALWMAHECQRRRDKNSGQLGLPPAYDDLEGKDIAAGVWLSISPSIENRPVSVQKWLYDAGHKNKIPMGFVYGKNDTAGETFSSKLLSGVTGGSKEYKLTGKKPIEGTNLTGSKLLDKNLETNKWIIDTYIAPVMEARGNKERKEREVVKKAYYYLPVLKSGVAVGRQLNKRPGEDAPSVDLRRFGLQ
jgi:hypothetical protein